MLDWDFEANNRTKRQSTIAVLVGIWIIVSGLFYFGIIEIHSNGQVESSLILGFLVISFGLHLFTILKKIINESILD